MKKRLWTILLALVMALSLTPFALAVGETCEGEADCTHFYEANGQHFTVLAEAISAAGGGTVKLLKNIQSQAPTGYGTNVYGAFTISPENTTYTLDLNGHTISLENASDNGARIAAVVKGNVTITDSAEGDTGEIKSESYGVFLQGNGALTLNDGSISSTGNYCAVQILPGTSLTMNGGTVEATHKDAAYASAILNFGTLTIEGGTVKGVSPISNNAARYAGESYEGMNTTCTITGGEIIGVPAETYKGSTASEGYAGASWGISLWGLGVGTSGNYNKTETPDYDAVVLNMSGGKVEAAQAICTNASNGASAGSTINISGTAQVIGTGSDGTGGTGMYLPAMSIVNISGGTISGGQGIRICAGELNITGGEVIGTEVSNSEDLIAGGSGGTSGAIVVGKAGAHYVGDIVVNIGKNATVKNTAEGEEPKAAIVVSDKNMGDATMDYDDLSISVNVDGATINGDVVKASNLTPGDTQDGGNTTLMIENAIVTGNVSNQSKTGLTVKDSTITGDVTNTSEGSTALLNTTVQGTVKDEAGTGSIFND